MVRAVYLFYKSELFIPLRAAISYRLEPFLQFLEHYYRLEPPNSPCPGAGEIVSYCDYIVSIL